MNTQQLNGNKKTRGSVDVTYLGQSVDEMILTFMQQHEIPGLTLAIVQAPYIPRVVGYGFSDVGGQLLASTNTLWPVGPISQGYAAVAVMQLYEAGKLDIRKGIGEYLSDIPQAWKPISILALMRHASGIADFRQGSWDAAKQYTPQQLIAMVKDIPLAFKEMDHVQLSATNFVLLSMVIAKASGMEYHAYVKQNQFQLLNLQHTAFAEDLGTFATEDVSKSGNLHQAFKSDPRFINPSEPAKSYDADGNAIAAAPIPGFSDVWASAEDVSFWDIGLAGSILIHDPDNRKLVYGPWKAPDGTMVPFVAGWRFFHHTGLMDIQGTIPGFSSFLSRFTDSKELVCVTLLANKQGIDFTNLGRSIAAAFGDLMSTNYDDNLLFLLEGQFSAQETVNRLLADLKARSIPVFATFDHAQNAIQVGLNLRPTTVIVFGSPKVGTALMELDQSISLMLPLRIAVWEDAQGSTWLAFPKMKVIAQAFGMEDNPVLQKMELLLEELVDKASSII